MVRKGLPGLEYLPREKCAWSATLAALAFGARREMDPAAALDRWARMHGVPASGRYVELGSRALVLWHGTSAERAEKIREVGLYPKKGIWATALPSLAHSFARGRGDRYLAGSAMIVLVFDREDMSVAFEPAKEKQTLRFRSHLGPEYIEYVLWDDRIEFVGARRAHRPGPWGAAAFKKVRGRWVPRSRPPVRFDNAHVYETLDEWVTLSVRRVVGELGVAAPIEVFSALYATIRPMEALSHDAVFDALDRLCVRRRHGLSLTDAEAGHA